MFLKGLRTQYISRESLNEANEARKNEDINKIIDIGRVRAEEESITCINFASTLNTAQKEDKEILKAGIHNLVDKRDEINLKKETNMDLIKELKNFSLLYEERVISEIIPNLLKPSVLDCALESLKELTRPKQNEKLLETPFLKKTQIFTEDPHSQTEILQGINPCSFFHQEPLNLPESSTDFAVDPVERLFVADAQFPQLKSLELKNNKPSYFPSLLFEKDHENINPVVNHIPSENKEKQHLHSWFNSPAAPFYRRNMF